MKKQIQNKSGLSEKTFSSNRETTKYDGYCAPRFYETRDFQTKQVARTHILLYKCVDV